MLKRNKEIKLFSYKEGEKVTIWISKEYLKKEGFIWDEHTFYVQALL